MNRSWRPLRALLTTALAACGPDVVPLESDLGDRMLEKICEREFDCYSSWEHCVWEQFLDDVECTPCTIDTSLARDCLHTIRTADCPDGTFWMWDPCLAAISCPEDVAEHCTGW